MYNLKLQMINISFCSNALSLSHNIKIDNYLLNSILEKIVVLEQSRKGQLKISLMKDEITEFAIFFREYLLVHLVSIFRRRNYVVGTQL